MAKLKADVPASPSTRIQRVVSAKGIEAWLVEDYTVPILSMDFAFVGGAAHDPDGKAGLSYVMSGLYDEGAGPLDAQAFHEKLDDTAVELSFSSNRDRLEGGLRTLTRNAKTAFDLLALAINQPRFDVDAIERVKAQVIAGLKRGETDPDTQVWRAFQGRAFKDHSYARPDKGTLESVPGITRADILAVHGSRLSRGNLKIAAVGAISPAELGKAIDRVFGALPKALAFSPIADTAIAGLGETLVTTIEVPQSTLALGRPGIARKDPGFMAAHVANHILGGGSFTSRLWTEVREKRGLAYSVWSQLSTARHAHSFLAGTATSNERVAESLKIIKAECLKMAEKGPKPAELDKALKFLLGSYALRFDTSRKIASHLVEIQIEDLGIDYIANRNGLLAAVTLAETRKAAERLIGDGSMLVSVAGKPKGVTASA